MNQIRVHTRVLLSTCIGAACIIHIFFPSPAVADKSALIKHIITFNLEALEKSLLDGTYRGEEGILRIRPEIGKSLGMKVFIDQDYLESKQLFKKAEASFDKAKMAMVSKRKEKFPGEYDQKIREHFLIYQKNTESGEKKLRSYHSRLNPGVDERLNDVVSTRVMEELLGESLLKTNANLRDALGHFYNVCQGIHGSNFPLTPGNVQFVNYVVSRFLGQATGSTRSSSNQWNTIASEECPQFLPQLEAAFKKFGESIYAVDPLLFIALMKKESDFDPLAVSYVGAAGLTQIMPQTAKYLGMKDIYMPEYLEDARSFLQRERRAKREAEDALFRIDEKNGLSHAKRARELMQLSLRLGQKRERLFSKYKRELLEKRTDNRFQPGQAIEYGLKYFARLMKDQSGDMSLALASYNTGPNRIKRFNGVPPYDETVRYRNKVLEYYGDYLRKAKGNR
jgi:soluble lytic murein transglycosylase-like protein